MTKLTQTVHVEEIEREIEHLFEYWMEKNFEMVEQYFHNHAIMIEAGTSRRIVGSVNIIENYRDFIEDADVEDHSITELLVDMIEDTAVAYIDYRIKYTVEDTKYDESNTDILVFRKHENNWRIIWRTQLLGG